MKINEFKNSYELSEYCNRMPNCLECDMYKDCTKLFDKVRKDGDNALTIEKLYEKLLSMSRKRKLRKLLK